MWSRRLRRESLRRQLGPRALVVEAGTPFPPAGDLGLANINFNAVTRFIIGDYRPFATAKGASGSPVGGILPAQSAAAADHLFRRFKQ